MSGCPKLRWPIEMRFEKIAEQEVLLIRCPLGITPQPLLLLSGAAPILACFDGKTSVDQILEKFGSYGITRELITELIAIMDGSFFLDNAHFHDTERRWREDFSRAAVREAALAGASYPGAPNELTRLVDSYLDHGTNGSHDARRVAALIAPHIDYRRGGVSYGISYRRLRGQRQDLYIVLGVAHMYSPHMFHLCRKDFTGPLGTHPCAREFVERLAARYGHERSFADEILHRNEHSVELQMPFLGRLHPGAAIVPILTGSFQRMLDGNCAPGEVPEYDEFAASLAECIREEAAAGKRVCILTAVDLAHIGQSFGDGEPLTAERMQQVADRDQLFLRAVLDRDKQRIFEHVCEDNDARRICGFPAIYTTVDVLERGGAQCTAELLDYRQAVDYKTDCAVTFAGIAMYEG